MGRRHRRAAYSRGRYAEGLAAWWLRLKGYRILARGYRVPVGEIDIVARRGRVLAMVEVKTRGREDAAADAITPRQRRRVERAALAFLQTHRAAADGDLRFDAILVRGRVRLRHIRDAWRPTHTF